MTGDYRCMAMNPPPSENVLHLVGPLDYELLGD